MLLKILKPTALDIQKDIVVTASIEKPMMDQTHANINDLGDTLFSILIRESRDTSITKKMVVVLCYVDKKGCVIEHFFGIVHVNETKVVSLKVATEALFSKPGLSIMILCGQGCNGANNMHGKFNNLKTLVMKENGFVFYVH